MTELKRSIFVVPTSSLEDLPNRMGHELALDFLNAWTSQWDPRLLVALGTLPEWKKADGSSLDLEHSLILCPQVSKSKLDQPLRERLDLGQCLLVDTEARPRTDLVKSLLASINFLDAAPDNVTSDIEPFTIDSTKAAPLLLDDFYALGYAVLQIQILARKLRYSWNIDWIMFTEQTLAAAKASIAGDADETERWLQTCFDSLSQERDRYCSQQAYLIDVVLLATTTLGASLDRQLVSDHPTSLLASSRLLKSLKESNPNAWTSISKKIAEKQISLVGGLEHERPHSYLSSLAIVRELGRGVRSYSELGVEPPNVFSRYQPGFTATSPTWLTQFGYTGSILAAWAEGTLPDKDQAKIRWQANSEGTPIDTVVNHVLDAASADSYIDLAETLSKQLDYHNVPTLVLAHWPGIRLQPQLDLLRVIARTPALGKFHTVDSYFSSTSQPYSSDSFQSNAFKLPIPKAVCEQNVLNSQIIAYQRIRVELERLSSLHYLWVQVGAQNDHNTEEDKTRTEIEQLLDTLDGWFDPDKSKSQRLEAVFSNLQERMKVCREHQLEQIRNAVGNRANAKISDSEVGLGDTVGYLFANPSNHPQRLFLEGIPGTIDPDSCTRIFAAESIGGKSNAVLDIPPFGFVRIRAKKSSSAESTSDSEVSGRSTKPSIWNRIAGIRTGIAQSDWTLANEFMEIQIDPKRGHLRSIYIANKRGSRLSGMASLVRGNSDVQRKWNDADCTDLKDIQLRVVRTSPLVGTIEVTGTSKQADGNLAKLTTRYTLWKGARWLNVEIRAENIKPDECGCVWRTAWLNEGATVSVWYQGIKGKLQSPLQASAELIEIDDAEHRIFFAPRGLSAHRRSESRFLITHIPIDVKGIANAKFAIGIDWPRPYETAMDQCDKPWMIEEPSVSNANPDTGAWLAQSSLSHVHFFFADPNPLLEPSSLSPDQVETLTGQRGDVCVWLQETQGKSGTARLSFFRDVVQAWRVDSQGREFDILSVVDGQIIVNVSAHQLMRILLRWKSKEPVTESNAS